jgi:two-component system chemotaxis response regulator CheY
VAPFPRIQAALLRRSAQAERSLPRVLVIDDEASMRTIVRVALSGQGWEILEAGNTAEGLTRAERERPDVVLLDVNFRGETRDGFAVCRELRSMSATRRTPVVLLTAQDDPESRAFASAVGATAYLAKPFAPADLLRMLRLVHGEHGARPALGLYLIDAGLITAAELEHALAEQRRRSSPMPLGAILVELGFVRAEAVRLALAHQRRARKGPRSTSHLRELRIVIADDHASVRDGLRSAFAAEFGMSVVGVAVDGDDALHQIRALRPDAVVLDNDMPKRTGLEVVEAIHAELPHMAIVMFTLDDSARPRALALGAAAVVTKDSPLHVLIAELRRAADAQQHHASAGVIAAQNVVRLASGVLQRRKRALVTMIIMSVAYGAGFLVLEPALGASAAVLQLFPVAIAGALFGPELGIGAAVFGALLTAALWQTTGHPLGEPILTIGGNWLGVLALIGLGGAFGAMRVVRGRLNPEARRAGALAEAALLLAAGGGPELLRLLARAALDVVPGEAALLFLPVPGGGLELVAAADAPATLIGSRQIGVAVERAFAQRHAGIVDAGIATIGVEVPRMRAAVVVPVSSSRGESRGVVAVLSARRAGLRDVDVEALSAYGTFVGLAIGMTAETNELPESRTIADARVTHS